MKTHPEINFFIFGHRHIELDLLLARETRLVILGDWISQFSYVVYDGEQLILDSYIEGESQP
jgi:UDP-2,3-diacylglucosamine hydrolase